MAEYLLSAEIEIEYMLYIVYTVEVTDLKRFPFKTKEKFVRKDVFLNLNHRAW